MIDLEKASGAQEDPPRYHDGGGMQHEAFGFGVSFLSP